MRKRLVVLLSGNGSNLQAIIDEIEAGKINADIVNVVSNRPDAYGITRAAEHGIASKVINHKDFTDRQAYDQVLSEHIATLEPDFVILAGYMRIMSDFLVQRFSGKMVNIHPSLLPKYKGLNTHQRAIDNGDAEHGVSIHFVTPELDGGPVVLQSRVPIFPEDDATLLAQRVQIQERQIYPLVIKWLCNERLIMRNNKAYLDDGLLSTQGYAND